MQRKLIYTVADHHGAVATWPTTAITVRQATAAASRMSHCAHITPFTC